MIASSGMGNGEKRAKMRCEHEGCKRRLNSLDVAIATCRCGRCFCKFHRLPETHACPIQYQVDKEKFVADNKCVAVKIAKA